MDTSLHRIKKFSKDPGEHTESAFRINFDRRIWARGVAALVELPQGCRPILSCFLRRSEQMRLNRLYRFRA